MYESVLEGKMGTNKWGNLKGAKNISILHTVKAMKQPSDDKEATSY